MTQPKPLWPEFAVYVCQVCCILSKSIKLDSDVRLLENTLILLSLTFWQTLVKGILLNHGWFYSPEDIWWCLQTFRHFWFSWCRKDVPGTHWVEARMLLNILQFPRQSPTPEQWATHPETSLVWRLRNPGLRLIQPHYLLKIYIYV